MCQEPELIYDKNTLPAQQQKNDVPKSSSLQIFDDKKSQYNPALT